MTIDIICPLYEGANCIEALHRSLLKQKGVQIQNIFYILTRSSDHTEDILKRLNISFQLIEKSEFSHSLVREKMAFQSHADLICLITQDIIIESDDWLEKLIQPIVEGRAHATYSRQLSKYNNIEKYTRDYNYPEDSFIKSKKDLERLGLKTFFFSDASSVIRRDIFVKLNGYDGRDLPINEDMYFAYKLIINGYNIGYCADSIVYHSHNFTLRQLYERYKLTGKFFKQNSYLDRYGTNLSGMGLARYILKRALQEKNIKVLCRYPFDMIVRFLGMKAGKM